MAKKITPEQITQMIELYSKLGTYAAVARTMGISSTTVSRYIKEAEAPKMDYDEYNGATPCELPNLLDLISYSTLTEEERESLEKWFGENKI